MANATYPVRAASGQSRHNHGWMTSISGQVRLLSAGDRAALRRMELTQSAAANGTVVKLLLGAKVPRSIYEPEFDRWRLLAHVTATISGTGAIASHDEKCRLGAALFEANVSENRILRLLAVRNDSLYEQIRLVTRMLARKRKAINLETLFNLSSSDPDCAEAARIIIAQDYYYAAA